MTQTVAPKAVVATPSIPCLAAFEARPSFAAARPRALLRAFGARSGGAETSLQRNIGAPPVVRVGGAC